MKARQGKQERERLIINDFYQIPQNPVEREVFYRNFLLNKFCPHQECFFILPKVGKSILLGFDFLKHQKLHPPPKKASSKGKKKKS